jgi:hypothetical protein
MYLAVGVEWVIFAVIMTISAISAVEEFNSRLAQ